MVDTLYRIAYEFHTILSFLPRSLTRSARVCVRVRVCADGGKPTTARKEMPQHHLCS